MWQNKFVEFYWLTTLWTAWRLRTAGEPQLWDEFLSKRKPSQVSTADSFSVKRVPTRQYVQNQYSRKHNEMVLKCPFFRYWIRTVKEYRNSVLQISTVRLRTETVLQFAVHHYCFTAESVLISHWHSQRWNRTGDYRSTWLVQYWNNAAYTKNTQSDSSQNLHI